MKRIAVSCLCVLFLIFFACSKGKKVPSDIIGQEKMGVILFELAMAEGYLESFPFRDSTVNRDSMVTVEMDKVLAIHRVSQKEFRDSYKFYKSRPEIFKIITDTVYYRAQRSPEKMYGKRPQPNPQREKSK
jgi:Domain of unknown function (DUF4296)